MKIFPLVASLLLTTTALLRAQVTVNPEQTQTLSGTSSAGSATFDVKGGVTTIQHAGPSQTSLLFRTDGGKLQFLDSATAATATITAQGGPGNGGRGGIVEFRNTATAAAATFTSRAGVLGPNFDEEFPNPIDGFGGRVRFYDTAKAGTAQAHFVNEGESGPGTLGWNGGATEFYGNSSADHADFLNQASTSTSGDGGLTVFEDTATADFGTFTNVGSNVSWLGTQGWTQFTGNSNAGHGTFTNQSSNAPGGNGYGGITLFEDNSNAADGIFINTGSTAGGFAVRGTTQFKGNASAGRGKFTNRAGTGGGGGGMVELFHNSTAADAEIVNDDPTQGTSGYGGEIHFEDDASAGSARLITRAVAGGRIIFADRTRGGTAVITAEPTAIQNSTIEFRDQTSAESATFELAGMTYLTFAQSATAANSVLTLRGTNSGLFNGGSNVLFRDNATAGNATITAKGAEKPGGQGGYVTIMSPATAGNATIRAEGANVTGGGPTGGAIYIDGIGGTAGTATLIADGSTVGGFGGHIEFRTGGQGPQARVIVNAGGIFDISANSFAAPNGTEVGSVEGAGSIILGSSLLKTGGLNTSTTISGVIANGVYGGNGGITKLGTGTLTLAGANTYTGLTTVEAGTLVVTGSLAGPVLVKSGATLKGSSNIAGVVTAEPGAKISPGTSPGTLTIGGLVLGNTTTLDFELGSTSDQIVVNGNLTLDGVLNITNAGGLTVTGPFELLRWTGTLTDNGLTIGTVPAGFTAADFSLDFSSGVARVSVAAGSGPTPPVINTQPTSAAATQGSTAQFTAAAGGAPGLSYRWQRKTAGTSTWTDITNGGAFSGASTATLSVTSTVGLTGDQFRVIIMSDSGSAIISGAATLSVSFASRLLNLSTRGLAQSGDNVLIPGFVISGTASKKLLIRAIGPTLALPPINFGGVVAPDPQMTLKRLNTAVTPHVYVDVAANDDWQTNTNAADITNTALQFFAFAFQDAKEAALLMNLTPGQYTVTAGDKNGTAGIAIVELYDADADGSGSQLINLSNRGFCGVGDQVMIPGFVVSSEGPKTLLVRVVGPGLAGFNVPGTMADPKLEVYPGGASSPILTNDNWSDNPDAAHTAAIAQQVSAFALAADSKDAAFVVTLSPGSYTVVGSSAVPDATGVVLVELYVVP